MEMTDGGFFLLSFVPLIFYLAIIVFGIYFVIKVIKFMNVKTRLDMERNEKIGELIKVIKRGNGAE
ncbi:hypothetical protein [Lentibacillus salicampi]|uniref:DUF4083 domain-containing protein n=1 Tax=Lentibacillus salicampi TaxID=175306 RepID=A0A4Y9ACQ4_9BACI|nr:hypothetical protein [Lentibacillus salicampi]TFJ93215.1 hypothetical protein E4U82_08420 [Lentibacillus salicampi]